MSVKIASKLPDGDADGLQAAEANLRERQEPVVVVAVLYPRSVSRVLDKEADPWLVTLGVAALEVMYGADALAARKLIAVEYERRTGLEPLPFEVDT